MSYNRYVLPGGPQSPARPMPPTPTMLQRENDTLAADNTALVVEQRMLQADGVNTRRWAEDHAQRNVVLGDEIHSAHRALAAANDEKNVLVREKAELNSTNKIMMQRINKLETMTKGREDSVREIGQVLGELRKVKTDLQQDNNSLKKQLVDKESALQTLEMELAHQPRIPGQGSPGAVSPAAGNISPRFGSPSEVRHNLQQRLRFLENVNKSLQNDNVSLNKSLDNLQQSITALRTSKMEDMEEIDALTRDLEVERRNTAALNFSLKQSIDNMKQRERELENSKADTQEVKQELDRQIGPGGVQREEIAGLEKKLKEITRLLTNVQQELGEKEEELRQSQGSLKRCSDENGELRAELEVAGSKSSSAAAQWEYDAVALKKQLLELRVSHDAEVASMREKMNEPTMLTVSNEGRVAEMEATLSAQASALEKKEQLLSEEHAKAAQLASVLAHQKNMTAEKEEQLQHSTIANDEMKESNRKLEGEIKRLSSVCEEQEDTIEHLRLKAQQTVIGNEQTAQRTADLETKIEALKEQEKEMEQREMRTQHRNRELLEKEERIQHEEMSLRAMEESMVKQQQQGAESAELQVMRKQIMDKEMEKELLAISNEKAEQEIQKLRATVEELTANLLDANFYKEREQARAEAPTPVTAAEELSRMEGLIDRLEAERDSLKKELEVVKNVSQSVPVFGEDSMKEMKEMKEGEAEANESSLRAQLDEAKAALGDGKKSGKGHKLELWQAEQLVTSWNIEVNRFLKFSERIRSTNRGLEAQLMRVHDVPASDSKASKKPKASSSPRLAAAITYTLLAFLITVSGLFFVDVALNPSLFEQTTLHTLGTRCVAAMYSETPLDVDA